MKTLVTLITQGGPVMWLYVLATLPTTCLATAAFFHLSQHRRHTSIATAIATTLLVLGVGFIVFGTLGYFHSMSIAKHVANESSSSVPDGFWDMARHEASIPLLTGILYAAVAWIPAVLVFVSRRSSQPA